MVHPSAGKQNSDEQREQSELINGGISWYGGYNKYFTRNCFQFAYSLKKKGIGKSILKWVIAEKEKEKAFYVTYIKIYFHGGKMKPVF